MTRKRLKTQEDLFIHILNKWLEDERQIRCEWGIGDRDRLLKNLNEEYEYYKELWNELKEQKNDR